jgi:hypothetical protein
MRHNVCFLSDLQGLVTDQDAEAYAVFLDFEKAYHRVNWDYMFRVLERMKCGSAFIAWVRLLDTDPEARLMIDGNILPGLHPTRGVKQGDPLSALLVLMVIKPRGSLLRAHEEYGVRLADSDLIRPRVYSSQMTQHDSTAPSPTFCPSLYCSKHIVQGSERNANLGNRP